MGEWEWDVEGEEDRWGNGSGMLKGRGRKKLKGE